MTLSAGTRLGPYEILSPLGAGGMGEVYKARDTRLERTVAVKVLPSHLSASPEVRQRFEREAKTISQLSHPHICAIHDVGTEGDTDYLVMEYLEGETLTDRLGKGALPLEQTLRYGGEIAGALDKAHRQGIVHRDLKPGNVMLTKSGVKLLDFGLAKAMAEPVESGVTSVPTVLGSRQNLTQEGTILGTFQYMAPEQLEGKEADRRSDIFALGAVLYEMATGRKAFSGASQASLISAIMKEEPASISAVQPMAPAALDRVVKTCLAKDPEDRWQSAADVARELGWIAEGSAAGVAAPATVVSKRRRREAIAWLVAAAGVAAAAALALTGLRRPAPQAPVLVSSLLLPSGLQLDELNRSLALSPDGTRLAIAASSQLWLRSLTGAEVRAIAGTEDASYPFWSPDGKSLGFFAAHKLKKLDLGSGAISTICAASEGRGGAWGPDGTIVFAPGAVGPLFRVPSAGGEAVPATKPASPKDTHRLPVFLPDGKRILFVAGTVETTVGKLRLLDLASGRVSQFSEENSDALFAKPGYLLFRRGKTLMAQPFDSDSARPSGSPASIAEELSFYQGRYAGQFTVSNTGLLVYEPEPALVTSQLTWFDTEGNRLATVGEPRAFQGGEIKISHDGRNAVATVRDPSQRPDIWVVDLQRGGARRLSFEPAGGETPRWSPDDRTVGYVEGNGSIWIKPLGEGGQAHRLPVTADLGSFSPDGTLVIVNPTGEGNTFGLSLAPVDGSGPVRSIVASHVQRESGGFSPDGRWIAYVSDESGRDELYVVSSSGSPGKWQISSNGAFWSAWLARSGELVFVEPATGKLFSVEFRVKGGDVEVGAPRPLFGGRPLPSSTAMDMTPDGKRILFAIPVERGGAHSLTLVSNWPALLRKP